LTLNVSRDRIYCMFNPKGIEKTKKYIETRLQGKSKRKSALIAGYSENTAHIPNKIEQGQNYKALVETINANNVNLMQKIAEKTHEALKNGISKSVLDGTTALKNIAQVYKLLSPEVKIKESKDADGNTKRTIWATGNTIPQASTPTENNTE